MGCTPKGCPKLEGGVTALVYMERTTSVDYPIIGFYLVLDVTPLNFNTN